MAKNLNANEIQMYKYLCYLEKPGGRLYLLLNDESTTQLGISDDLKLLSVIDMLRSEAPCFWYEDASAVGTSWEPVGMEEDDEDEDEDEDKDKDDDGDKGKEDSKKKKKKKNKKDD